MVAKCAVIGCGRMGAQKSERLEGIVPSGWLPISHAESIEQTDIMSLVALSDNDENRLTEVSSDYDVDEKYLDYEKLLKDVQLDIVTVATRTPMKFDIIKSSILKGVRGIYVEKPLSNSLRKTVELLELADSHRCFYHMA
ncbi:Gfo/Idh/MocA family oxidoreductase [Vibrio lentus]|nr:Gfo/Idh/MocA family oxidoreductase [Vibrio lentus]